MSYPGNQLTQKREAWKSTSRAVKVPICLMFCGGPQDSQLYLVAVAFFRGKSAQ